MTTLQQRLRRFSLQPTASGRYLQRAVSGERFFPQADTAWELFHRLTKEEAIDYLSIRQKQGFNAIFAVLIPELDAKPTGSIVTGPDGQVKVAPSPSPADAGSTIFWPNRYGHVPFTNDDLRTPNESYFEHVDWVIDQAAQRDLTVFLVPTWSRYLNGGWAGGPVLFDKDSAYSFGKFVGLRYPYLPKLLGGDSNPQWTDAPELWKRYAAQETAAPGAPPPTVMDLPRIEMFDLINAMASGFTETELDLKPFLAYHPAALWLPWSKPASASSFFGDQDWLVLDGVQSGHTDFFNLGFQPPLKFWNARASHLPIGQMWANTRIRPVMDLESHYEDTYNALDSRSPWKWNGDDIRSGAWQSILSGACGIVYGANAVWQMYDAERAKNGAYTPVCGLSADSSWKVSLQLPGPSYLHILRSFFESIPQLDSLQPAQALLKSTKAPTDKQDMDGRIDIMCDAGKNDKPTIAIAHSGMGFGFGLEWGKWGAPSSARWLDPRTGSIVVTPVVDCFVPPSEGSVQEDWVLVLNWDS